MSDSSDSSEEEAVVVAALLAEPGRMWVHEHNKKRAQLGEFKTIFEDLKRDATKFLVYFRMSLGKFEELLGMVEPHITKMDTTFRKSISPQERLALTLRY